MGRLLGRSPIVVVSYKHTIVTLNFSPIFVSRKSCAQVWYSRYFEAPHGRGSPVDDEALL